MHNHTDTSQIKKIKEYFSLFFIYVFTIAILYPISFFVWPQFGWFKIIFTLGAIYLSYHGIVLFAYLGFLGEKWEKKVKSLIK